MKNCFCKKLNCSVDNQNLPILGRIYDIKGVQPLSNPQEGDYLFTNTYNVSSGSFVGVINNSLGIDNPHLTINDYVKYQGYYHKIINEKQEIAPSVDSTPINVSWNTSKMFYNNNGTIEERTEDSSYESCSFEVSAGDVVEIFTIGAESGAWAVMIENKTTHEVTNLQTLAWSASFTRHTFSFDAIVYVNNYKYKGLNKFIAKSANLAE